MIPYGHQTIEDDDIAAVVAVLHSEWLTQGPAVEAFEQALAAYCGTSQVVMYSSGTSALQGAYFAAGFAEGDEFITTPLTFCATSNAGIWQGGKPVFVDIDPRTGNLDPALIEAAITPKTKAIVPVDYAGHPADMPKINEIARAHGLVVIEDACHALGGSIGDKRVGSHADMTIFSFHPVKSITTGEGGAVTTDDPEFAQRLRLFRTHGITKEGLVHPSPGAWYQEMQELGVNARITDIQCALGISQLKKLNRFLAARKAIVQRYAVLLADLDLELPTESEGYSSGWHLYPIRLRGAQATRRAEVFASLRAAGIGVQVHYIPVYFHPYYERLGYARRLCPKAEAFYEAVISLPIFPALTEDDQRTVATALRAALNPAV